MKQNGFLAPSKLKAAIAYILSIFLASSIVSILLSMLIGQIQGVPAKQVFDSYLDSGLGNDIIDQIKIISQGWANFICYLIALLLVGFWMRNHLREDYLDLLAHKKKYAIWIPCAAIGFVILAIGIDHVFGKLIPASENQKTIEDLLHSSGAVPMIIATIFFAPVVEELIYRKAIFHAFRSYGAIPAYITSIVLFTLPHMLSTQANIGIWILQCIPYALCGFMLCFIYHKSGKNIYVSIAAHILNNFAAVLFVYIQF